MNKHQIEFIGEQLEVIQSSNKEQIGICGKIIDETKNTFKIKTDKKILIILKTDKKFKIQNQKIDGNKISKRPEERIKIKEK